MNSSFVTSVSSPTRCEVGSDNVWIAWIDVSALTRECMTHAVRSAQKLFMIVPFASVHDFIKESDRKPDLIVYHSHETDSVNTADIAALRDAFSTTQLVVLSDATDLDPAIVQGLANTRRIRLHPDQPYRATDDGVCTRHGCFWGHFCPARSPVL